MSSLKTPSLIAALVGGLVPLAPAQTINPSALPTGGQITAGQGNLQQQGGSLTVNQSSQRLITEWSSFNIGTDAAVRFNQPGADAIALNRVTGQDTSQILGSLQANGQVFLINPNGLYFGKNATVNVGGLVASTLGLADVDFLGGKFTFAAQGGGPGTGIVNEGDIAAAPGGIIAFISPRVSNDGSLTANGGTVALAAGDKVTLDFNGDGLINLSVDSAAVDAQVLNRGLIKADGGVAMMTARAAGDLAGSVVNNEGIVEANTLVSRGGRILLDGGDAGVVKSSGNLLAVGAEADTSGGEVIMTGDKVGLFNDAVVDASGAAGGGRVALGGGFQGQDNSIANAQRTFVGSGATIRADATASGNGGDVVVWSDDLTRFQGTVTARGGSLGGNGGAVEISGKGFLEMVGLVDAGATQGAGGTVLFDPKDIIVQAGGGAALTDVDAFTDNASGTSTIDPGTITTATNAGTAVTLQANNDVTINSSIFTVNGSGTGGALTFNAGRNITINSNIYSDDGSVSFVLNDSGADGANRDLGAAAFVNNSLVDAGSGTVSITMGNESTSGSIGTGQITAKNLNITHNGPTAGAASGQIDLGELTVGTGTGVGNDLTITANSTRNVVNTVGNVTVLGTTTINAAGGDVTLTRPTTDLNIVALTSAGTVTLNDTNALRFGPSNITGTLTATTQGPIASTGAVTVAGLTTLTANSGGFGYADPYINLSNNNDFQNGLALSVASNGETGTGGYANIKDVNDLAITSATLGKYFTVTGGGAVNFGPTSVGTDFTVTTTGAITDTGTITVPGYAQFTAGAANNITFDSAANNFSYVRIGSGKDVILNDTNAIQFGYYNSSVSTISGDLSVTAGGDISQYGYSSFGAPYDSRLLVTGNSQFTVTAANSNLFLGYIDPLNTAYGLANNLAGTVTIAKSGGGSYQDIYLRNISASTAQIIGLATVGTLRDVSLRYDNATSVDLPGMTLSRNLSLSAPSGAITQSGALVVPGITMLRASGSSDITLTNAGNNFYRVGVNGARDVSLTDSNAIELYGNNYQFSLSRDLTVTAGGAITDASTWDDGYNISVAGGTATFAAGSTNNITFDNIYNQFNRIDVASGNNVALYDRDSLVLGNSTITGTFLADSWLGGSLTQVASTAIHSGSTTTFNNFTSGITLDQPNNVLGNIALSSDTNSVILRENDAITQASAWSLSTYRPTVSLTTSDDQAIVLGGYDNRFGNLTVTQINNGNLTPGTVSIRENDYDPTPANSGISQGGVWTTHGATTLDSGAYSITLANQNNVFGPLQVLGATGANQNVTIFAKETAGHAAIFDTGAAGAWSTGTAATNLVSLVAYDTTGTTAGAGNVSVTQTGNVLGDLYVRGDTVSITDSTSLTDGATSWATTGVTTLNAGTSSIVLDNLTNSLGAIALGGAPSSVLITDNTDLTQASAWTVGSSVVTADARNHNLDLSKSGNVFGNVNVTTANGVPLSVKITENDAITQGSVWSLAGVPVTLLAENDKAITLTDAANIVGNLTVTGGDVAITENDAMTQGGAWTTTATTTLNVGTNVITLNNTDNVLGDLAITGSTSAVSIAENSDITQAAAWSLASTPVTLNAQTHDIFLTQSANQLGDLTLTGQNVSVRENHLITDANAWTVPGLTTLTAGTNAIILDANPKSDFGTVKIVSASAADVTDINGIVFDASSVTNTLSVNAGGHITQTGAITASSLLLTGTGYATLNNTGNNVADLAAGFSGGDLSYTDADDFAVSVIGATTGVNIGANDVTLNSVAGTVTGLTSVNANSHSLTVSTGTPLTLPQMTIAGAQTYTATGGITLNAGITGTSAGAITFNSPVTLGADLSIQSANSPIVFNGTVAGANHQLIANAVGGAVDFYQAVSGLGDTSSAGVALQLTSGGAVFHDKLGANNGLSITGPVTFLDDVTLANGNAGSVFAGIVTLGKVGGMGLSGYDGMTFNGGVVLQNGASTISSNDSPLVFQGTNTISGPFGLTLDAGSQQITGLDHVGATLTSLSVTSSSPTIPSGGISIAGPQSYTATNNTNITLNGDVTSTAPGAIAFNSPVFVGADATVTSSDSAITFGGTLDGAHNLTLASGTGAKTFTGKIGNVTPLGTGTGYALTLTGSGGALFSETVSAASGLSIAGPATFTKNVALLDGSVGSSFSGPVIAGGLTLSGYDGLTFSNTLTLSGALDVNSQGGALSFGNAVGGPSALTLDVGAGSVAGLDQLASTLTGLTINNDNAVTLPALTISGPQIYNGPVSITGDLTGTALTFNQPATIDANNLTLSAGTGTIGFLNTVALGSNNLVMDADEIDLGAALTGTGDLTLRPASIGANVALGGATATSAFDLTAADLAWLPSTLSGLTIGRTDGTGTLAIVGATNVGGTALTLHGGGGISQTAALTSGPLTLRSAGTGIDLSNTANSLGAITITGTPSSVNIADSTDLTQGAAWLLGGGANVTLDAGTHDIFLTQAANTFGAIAVTGRDAQIVENAGTDLGTSSVAFLTVNSAGALYVVGALTATGDVAFTAANLITQTAPVTIGGNLSLTTTHNAGNVYLNNSGAPATVLGNHLVGGNYELTSSGDPVSQATSTNVQVAGNLTIDSASATLDGAGNLVQGTTSLPGVNTLLRQSGVITLGNINEAGSYTVISEAANRSFDSGPVAGTAIFFNNAANNIAGPISVQTVAPNITTGPDVQTGIVQSAGTSISVAGTASFTAGASSAGSLGIDLSNTGNSFGLLKLSGDTVTVRNDAAGLTTIDSINAGTRAILTAAGDIAQTGAILTPELAITSGGAVTLNNVANSIDTLALNTQGDASYVDATGVSIGTVGALSGIDTHDHALALTTGAMGDLVQTAALENISILSATTGGALTLTNAANTITALGAMQANGALQLTDSASGLLLSGPVQSATGDIVLRTSGDLTLTSGSSVTATTGDFALSTEGAGNFINHAGASALTAGAGKRWLVYTMTPDLVGTVHTEKGGLTSSFRLYGKTYATDLPVSIVNSGNGFIYADAAASALTISPTIVGSATHVYGDTPSGSLGYTVSSGFVDSEDTTDNIGITGTALYSGSLSNTMDAGAYSFLYTGGLSSSYTLIADTNGVGYTVTTAPLTYVADTASRMYGDANPALTGSVTGFKLGQDNSVLTGAALWTTTATTADHVGQYGITGSGYSSANYHFVQASGNGTALTIVPRTIAITADGQQRIYGDGNPSSGTFVVSGSGLVNGDALDSAVAVSSTATPASDVGSYNLTPNGATFTAGQSSDYAITYTDGVLAVTPRAISVTASDQSRIYGDANPTTGVFTVGGLGLVNGDTLNPVASVSSTATTVSDVGSYGLTPAGATFGNGSASNYAITYLDGALAVTPRALTVTADDQTRYYGNANPTTGTFSVSGQGLVNGDALNSLVTVSSTATVATDVGTANLTPSGATFATGSSSNYTVSYADGSLGIVARPITITPSTASRIYGDANPTTDTFAIGGLGLANADAVSSSINVTTPATTGSDVGSYALDGSGLAFSNGSAGNYAVTYEPGALNVTPATLTYTADPAARIYGDSNPALTGTVGGFRNSDTLDSATTGSMLFGTTATTTNDVGNYAINGSGLSATNYVFVQAPGNATAFSITPRPLTISALDQTRVYGDANPASISATANNLVNGDTLGGVTISTPATLASNVGTYEITPTGAIFSTGTASNYSISYVNGALVITPRPLTVTTVDQSRLYGAANPLYGSVTANNLANGDTLGVSQVSSPATMTSDVGTYALSSGAAAFTQGSAANYAITYVDGALAVTPRALIVAANDQSRVYGAANPTSGAYSLSGDGLVNGDALAATVAVSSNATAGSNVGTYDLTPAAIGFTQGKAANYAVSYADGALAVTPATLTYTATPVASEFGDSLPPLTGTVTGFVNSDTQGSATSGSLVWTTPALPDSLPGLYAIDGTGLTSLNGNYVFAQAPGNATALNIGNAVTPPPVLPDLGPVFSALSSFNEQLTAVYQPYGNSLWFIDVPATSPDVSIISGGVSPWSEPTMSMLLGFSEPVPSTPTGSQTTPASSEATFSSSGAGLTLSFEGAPPSESDVIVYQQTGDTITPAGSFTVNDGGSNLTMLPKAGEAAPFPASLDTEGARKASVTLTLAGEGQIELSLTLTQEGFLIAEAPASWVKKRGAKGAALAALVAVKREFGVLPRNVKAVKIIAR